MRTEHGTIRRRPTRVRREPGRDRHQASDAKKFAIREVRRTGRYRAVLLHILRLSPRSLGFVWQLVEPSFWGAMLVQAVKDSRDAAGRVPRNSALGRFVEQIIGWPQDDEIVASCLVGQHVMLKVRVNREAFQ